MLKILRIVSWRPGKHQAFNIRRLENEALGYIALPATIGFALYPDEYPFFWGFVGLAGGLFLFKTLDLPYRVLYWLAERETTFLSFIGLIWIFRGLIGVVDGEGKPFTLMAVAGLIQIGFGYFRVDWLHQATGGEPWWKPHEFAKGPFRLFDEYPLMTDHQLAALLAANGETYITAHEHEIRRIVENIFPTRDPDDFLSEVKNNC